MHLFQLARTLHRWCVRSRRLAVSAWLQRMLDSPAAKKLKNRLPDILGKALALIWIDREFHNTFARDPQGTLESQGIFLPDNMVIEFQKPNSDRPRIVVYETRPNSKFKLRVFYLQLVMMAGR